MVEMRRRPVHPALLPYVEELWHSEAGASDVARERSLPSGRRHLVIRLTDTPIAIFADAHDSVGARFHGGVLGGGRAGAYLRGCADPVVSVGATLRPAGLALLGLRADDVGAPHHGLADVWAPAARLRERLQALADAAARLDHLEAALVAVAPASDPTPAAVRMALRRLDDGDARIADVRDESGYSARGFTALFHAHVGHNPKMYARIRRFQRAIRLVRPEQDWTTVALLAGYADHPHLVRDFREFAGITPRDYRPLVDQPNHVPVRGVAFVQAAGPGRP